MNKIEMGKKYRTRNGKEVRVLCVDHDSDTYPVVAIIHHSDTDSDIYTFTRDGHYWFGQAAVPEEDEDDLVEVRPYDRLNIDDPVVVTDYPDGTSPLYLRHFAGVDSDGHPLAWINGRTSHTEVKTSHWVSCTKFDPALHNHISKGD